MGFLDRFRKKEKQNIVLRFGETRNWLKQKAEEEFSPLQNMIKETDKAIEKNSSSILNDLKGFKEAEIQEKMDERLASLAQDNKTAFIAKMDVLVQELEKAGNIEKAKKVYDNNLQKINDFIKKTDKNSYFIDMGFPKTAQSIKQKINNITKNIHLTKKKLEQNKEMLDNYKKIENLIAEIEQDKNNRQAAEKEKEAIKKQITMLGEKLDEKNKQLDKMRSSQELKQVQELENQIHKTERELSRLNDNIFQIISPLNRPLRKFRRSALLEKNEEEILDKFIAKPLDAVQNHHKELVTLVGRINTDILKEEKNYEKLQLIVDSVKNSELETLANKKTKLLEEKQDRQQKLNQIKIRQDIQSLKKEISSLETDIKEKEAHKKELGRQAEDLEKFGSQKLKKLSQVLDELSEDKVDVQQEQA